MTITITSAEIINPISVAIAGVGTAGSGGSGGSQVQTDWNATTGLGVLLNKPTAVSAFTNDSGYLTEETTHPSDSLVPQDIINIGNLSGTNTGDQVIPTTLPASDVYPWAKDIAKPTYVWSEIGSKPTFATVATSGSYTDLSNLPTIPAAQVQTDWNASTGLGVLLNKPDLSAMTNQGNTFNGASQLVKLDATGKLPAVNGSLLTGISGGGVSIPSAYVSSNIYLNHNLLTIGTVGGMSQYYQPCIPIVISKTTTINALVMSTTTTAVKTCTMAIYSSNPTTGHPDTRLAITAGMDMSIASGIQYGSISPLVLTAGVYWVALYLSNEVGMTYYTASTYVPLLNYLGTTVMSSTASTSALSISVSTYGVLPSSLSVPMPLYWTTEAPLLGVRVQ